MFSNNLNVFIVDRDVYARYAISSYLSWDRRTRVTQKLPNLEALEHQLRHTPKAELPDSILLDAALLKNAEDARLAVGMIKKLCQAKILVLAHELDHAIGLAVRQAGANGYMLREEVGLRVSWMVVWAQTEPFVITQSCAEIFPDIAAMPRPREYPELTDRIRQALLLCVVEGMSAELAADEMGLSPHTIRTYIKEGYSILEARDQTPYPAHLSPQEKAFMRLTALELDKLDKNIKDHR